MIELSGTRSLGIPPRPTTKNIIISIEKKGRECLLDFGLIWVTLNHVGFRAGKWQVALNHVGFRAGKCRVTKDKNKGRVTGIYVAYQRPGKRRWRTKAT
jgi:hypothetical protein